VRRARIRTTHESPAVVAGAVEPDNTASMTTRVDGSAVETVIERETTGGLHSSVDDYVVNLTVADRLVDSITATGDTTADVTATDTDTTADTQTTTAADDAQPDDHTDTTDNTDDTHE
jgi:hypothetical protein